MIELVDTHAHLDGLGEENPAEALAALDRAAAAGVSTVIAVGGNPTANRVALEMAARRPTQVWAAIGYDRTTAEQPLSSLPDLESLLASPAIVAIGEIGLDFHHHAPSTAPLQIERLETMLALARRCRLPVIVHVREAEEIIAPRLEHHASLWPEDPDRIGVIHCFTGSPAFAERMAALGFSISFSGILTFLRADNVRAAARVVPPHRLLVETDTPYLAPVPLRGRRNEPAYLPPIVHELARVRARPFEEIAHLTTTNARRLFGLNPPVRPPPAAAEPPPP